MRVGALANEVGFDRVWAFGMQLGRSLNGRREMLSDWVVRNLDEKMGRCLGELDSATRRWSLDMCTTFLY